MVWLVSRIYVGLRPLLVLHIHISPSTSSGQRNCASWASHPQKSVTLQPQPGGETTKSETTGGGSGEKKKINNKRAQLTLRRSLKSHVTLLFLDFIFAYNTTELDASVQQNGGCDFVVKKKRSVI